MFGAIILFYILRIDDELRFAQIPICSFGERPSAWLLSTDVPLLLIPLLGLWLKRAWSLLIALATSFLLVFAVVHYILTGYIRAAEIPQPQWNWELLRLSVSHVYELRAYYFVILTISVVILTLSLKELWYIFKKHLL